MIDHDESERYGVVVNGLDFLLCDWHAKTKFSDHVQHKVPNATAEEKSFLLSYCDFVMRSMTESQMSLRIRQFEIQIGKISRFA
jgi:capsule polysaccharide modification protein KpsS